ncbi:cora-domain-containing protein [Stylonychia lemnae]|uniref:Cora-domain-containing protein n=1 Tax=Stylonychia lemnae TaxID=5949 RepID=A0A078APP4_STYLE|nr:cora-domain-containing protein [Stylonychia lemnae]|eukprot:CDW84134.1 cora-domain-containing protein [Stylonychia lemnae]
METIGNMDRQTTREQPLDLNAIQMTIENEGSPNLTETDPLVNENRNIITMINVSNQEMTEGDDIDEQKQSNLADNLRGEYSNVIAFEQIKYEGSSENQSESTQRNQQINQVRTDQLYEESRDIESVQNENIFNLRNNKLQENENLEEVVRSIKRSRLDSLLGISGNFLNQQNDQTSQEIMSQGDHQDSNGCYAIFDLGNKQYTKCSLDDILSFKNNLLSNLRRNTLNIDSFYTNDKNNSYMIMLTSIKEKDLRLIMSKYNLNPIIIWEIILKQQYDKIVTIDEQTAFYNFEVIEENQLQKKFIIKVIHQYTRNIMFVLTTMKGQQPMMNIMRNLFKFKDLAEMPVDKRRSIIDDNSPLTIRVNEEAMEDRLKFLQELKLNLAPSTYSNGHAQQEQKDKKERTTAVAGINDDRSSSDNENDNLSKSDESFVSQFVGLPKRQETFGKLSPRVSQRLSQLPCQLNCEDILFGIIDESLRKIEPIILRFEIEAQALNNLSLNLSHFEKLDYVRRSHMAKDVMMSFENDLDIKEKFFRKLKNKKFISNKFKLLIKFLKGRLYNSQIIMKKAKNVVQLSDQTYENMVDNKLNEHSNNLNRIMQGLAAITVIFLPFNVISGFMGMNVQVPMGDEETILPFFMLFVAAFVLAFFSYFLLKCLKWL